MESTQTTRSGAPLGWMAGLTLMIRPNLFLLALLPVAVWQPLAKKGNPVAQNNIGIMYLDGRGVPQDTQEAVRYLTMAASSGSARGQNSLGALYRTGKGVPQDFVLARRWFTASANQGDSAGMYNLGLMFELGQGMKADLPRAYAWYALAAEQGDVPAAAKHRDNALDDMDRSERRQARSLYETCKSEITACN